MAGGIFTLTAPDGTVYNPTTVQQAGDEVLLTFKIDNPVPGQWHLTGTIEPGVRAVYQADAGTDGVSYHLISLSEDEEFVSYQEPIRIIAGLSEATSINGANVYSIITAPDGQTTTLPLANGAPGLYFGEYATGGHTGSFEVAVYAHNDTNQAVLTYEGATSADENGNAVIFPSDQPVGENFTRASSYRVTVLGPGEGPIQDVANAVMQNVLSWTLDKNTGALVATIQITNNGQSGQPLEQSFWYAIQEENDIFLANSTGTTTDGLAYADVTAQVTSQLPTVGNGDQKLDAGESATFTVAIFTPDRSIPEGYIYTILAD